MEHNHRSNAHGLLDASLLTAMPPFSKLDVEQIRSILDHAVSRRYDADTNVFDEGHSADRFYMLLDGYIRVVKISPQGERVIALHIPNGQLFGIAKALGRTEYPATAVAATECLALSWPQHFWTDFARDYEGFATETYKIVGQRVDEMTQQVLELSTQQVRQRIANAILRLVRQSGHKVENGIEIDFPITRRDLSEMTGATLFTVSRTLSSWERDGMISSDRKIITVHEPHQMVILAEGSAQA